LSEKLSLRMWMRDADTVIALKIEKWLEIVELQL
jgi:hypothetical protein